MAEQTATGPKVTVVVPSFNQAQFLREALDSILAQSAAAPIQCIVMDGGSTDGSVEVIREFAGAAERVGIDVHWESKRDDGQASAIREGFRRATGDILAYLNSDDRYLPETFSRVAEAFARDVSAVWLTGDCRIIDGRGREIQRGVRAYRRAWARRYSRTKLHLLNFIAQPATFWRRTAAQQVGEFDSSLHFTMDYDYWLRLADVGDLLYVDTPLADFRIHRESKGGSRFGDQFREDLVTVARYEARGWVRAFHRVHNAAIVSAYRILK